jgi:transposase
MDRYIGLDAHAASCTLAVVSAAGTRLRCFPVETNGSALVEAIRAIPGRRHLIFEEGAHSAWLYETLEHHTDEIVVAGVTSSRGSKSDARDAYSLAEKLRTNAVDRRVFKAPRKFSALRELARVHTMLVRDVVRVQSRIKSIYRARAIPTTGLSVYGPKREHWQSLLPADARHTASILYAQYDSLRALKDQAEEELVTESRKLSIARVLQTAPGLGPIRVARLIPIVITPHRFRTKRQLWSYSGLGIVTRSSSDWIMSDGQWRRGRVAQTRGLSLQHNHTLKDIFKGAATTVVQQATSSPLHAEYQRMLDGGTKPNLAKLTIARKIAAIVLRMWKNEEVYRPNHVVTKQVARRAG